jgi:hypothetical protein
VIGFERSESKCGVKRVACIFGYVGRFTVTPKKPLFAKRTWSYASRYRCDTPTQISNTEGGEA